SMNISGATAVQGIRGTALSFNGDTQYAAVNNISPFASGGDLTLASWIRLDSLKYAFIADLPGFYFFRSVSGSIDIYVSPTAIIPGGAIKTNTWYFVVATYSSTAHMIVLYIDGKEVSRLGSIPSLTISSPIYLGNYRSPNSSYDCRCTIDEFSLYTESLSVAQIEKLYAEGAPRHYLAFKP
ncbi:MAG: LamG domain-containing protein, partial [Candidatus Taylorbacteria bacterium]|nr:LamG domain-containing protein [Candidatus Taylorbacteria bacterium]